MIFEKLPAPVRENGLFCCWRLEERDGKATKVPYDPTTGQRAQSNNPNTFTSFTVATMAAVDYSGIGVGIFGELGAIDLDHCLTDSGVEPWAQDIVTTMHSYTEVSPSGKGLRILFPVTQPFQYNTAWYYVNRRLDRAAGTGIEVYVAGATKKYVTVTGEAVHVPFDTPWTPRNAELVQVLERYMVREQPKQAPQQPQVTAMLNDMELLDKARNAKNGATFSRLWAGDISGYPSHSEADQALCNLLAFWTGRNPEQMDRLFRQSGLMREKWGRRQSGSSYGAITVQRAISSCREVYTPRADIPLPTPPDEYPVGVPETAPTMEQRPRLVCAAEVPYSPPRWLMRPYLQKGKGTLIQADNGVGKTALVCCIAAHVTTGRPFGGEVPIADPGNVLLISVEDDLPVLSGRLEANGADMSKVHMVADASDLTFTDERVEAYIKATRAKLVVFDPFQCFIGAKVDVNRANETRPQLARLFEMCDRNDCACIIVAHMSKGSGDKAAVNRSLGSVDIPAAMRSILLVSKNPENPEERVVIQVKSSNDKAGQSFAYKIVDRGAVEFTGFRDLTEERLNELAQLSRKGKGKPELYYENEPLVQVLNQMITDHPDGVQLSYGEFKTQGQQILGFPPYYNLTDLREKLAALAKELQERDGIIVEQGVSCPHKNKGLRVLRYRLPEGYQTQMSE